MILYIKVNALNIIRSNILPGFSKLLQNAFSDKYLILTNLSLSMTLSGLGDVIEQNYEIMTDKSNKWDKIRTMNMSISGLTAGIVCHHWYRWLDKFLPGYTIRIVMKKIMVDQFVGSPLCIITFFGTIGALEGSSREEIIKEIKDKSWKLYAADWTIWPPAQFINFYLLSPKYRVLFDNFVSLGYDVFTSHVKYSDTLDPVKKNENS